MQDYLKIANSGMAWILCSVTIIITVLQAVLYMRMAKKTAAEAKLDPSVAKTSFRIGLISAIGPAMGVFIVMVGLMAAIGGPMAWLRLSIIGAAPTELTAATYGAQASGVELGGPGYGLTAMAVSWFAMALNGAGWLVFTGLFTPSLEKLRDKMSGGDTKWLIVLSGACSLGIFGYLNNNEIIKGGGSAVASICGALSMVFLVRCVVPKCPRLMEYSLGIAMIAGMACAVFFDTMAGK
ncbi:DUF5058 family protein [Cloacibacillus sp. An23]|uniref:DUF5058 family protein n=1 Tax=Cloacibacillus sp. An23 TaxID=1965591 RepID=UPI000B3A57D3|nr:DUF5058 family protein [Cloacibacillus sp. An23]OUO93251.1 DUF5058 domain-containing protein [Cloacibacillus sp. An23]